MESFKAINEVDSNEFELVEDGKLRSKLQIYKATATITSAAAATAVSLLPASMVWGTTAPLTNAARVVPGTANVTLEDAFAKGSGGTPGKGLQLKGDANGTGSDLIVTVWVGIGD